MHLNILLRHRNGFIDTCLIPHRKNSWGHGGTTRPSMCTRTTGNIKENGILNISSTTWRERHIAGGGGEKTGEERQLSHILVWLVVEQKRQAPFNILKAHRGFWWEYFWRIIRRMIAAEQQVCFYQPLAHLASSRLKSQVIPIRPQLNLIKQTIS